MRKVLVPTDFSENAFNALKYACQVFKYEKSEFYIMHAYYDEVHRSVSVNEPNVLEDAKKTVFENSEEQLKKIKDKLRDYSPNPKHTYNFVSDFANLIDAANDWVEKENIDIAVMGTRGETNDRSITFGTNTLHMLKHVKCPVLGIPEAYKYDSLKEILFPTNYLICYRRRELKLLSDMAGSFRSTIHMLYLNPIKELSVRQEDNQKFLKGCLQKPKLLFETSEAKEKSQTILEFIESRGIDMLVMVNSRHSHFEDMLYRSTIDKLGLQLKIPFLVMQNLAR